MGFFVFYLFNSSVKGDRIPLRNTIIANKIFSRMKPKMNTTENTEFKESLQNPNPRIIRLPSSIRNIGGRKIGIRKIKHHP